MDVTATCFPRQLKSTSYSHRSGLSPTTAAIPVQHVSLESPQDTPGQHHPVREIFLSTIDPALTGRNTPPALAPAWDASPDSFPNLAGETSLVDSSGIPARDLAPGSATMPLTGDPETGRVHGHNMRGDAAASSRWIRSSQRFEPYPQGRQEHRPARIPSYTEDLEANDEGDHKFQIPYPQSHQQTGTGGYQNSLEPQQSGTGSAAYAHASYMCNPPSRSECRGDAHWPSGNSHAYMTNAEVCQPSSYDAHRIAANHSVTGEGFEAPPLYYAHNHAASLTAPQYHQNLAETEFSASCVDPAIISIPQNPNFDVQQTQVRPTSHVEPPPDNFSPGTVEAYGGVSNQPRQKRSPSSPAADQGIVAPDAPMDITQLDNPLPETHHHPGWRNVRDQPMVNNGGPSDHRSDEPETDGSNSTLDEDYAIITKAEFTNGKSRSRPGPSRSKKEQPKRKGGPRGPFADLRKRAETAETRRRRACTRCREQKTRCETDPNNPDGDCQPCKDLNRNSKKTIHRAPCQRGKITDATLVRQGGLNLTQRWQGTDMKDVADRRYPTDIREIEFTLGTCVEPIRVKVVRFEPRETDVTCRFWTDRNRKKKMPLATYCLADIYATARYYEEYVRRNAIPAMRRYRKYGEHGRSLWYNVIEHHYEAALNYYEDLGAPEHLTPNPVILQDTSRKRKLLENLFMLWFTSRQTTGMSYICGKETLGMEPPIRDESYPLFGRISVPRMIVAQFDSINHEKFLRKYSKEVLKDLEYFMNQKSEASWWIIYLTLWIICREASWLTEDRYRHARNNYGDAIRYTLPVFVEELQASMTLIIQHWHYYNTLPWPNPLAPWERHKTAVALPTSVEYMVVMEAITHGTIENQLKYRRAFKANNYSASGGDFTGMIAMDWDHPLFWITQIYETDWTPHQTYQREPVPQ